MSTRCTPKFLGRYPATATADGNKLVIDLQNVCCENIVQGDKISFFIPHCITYPSTAIKGVEVTINGTEFTAIKFGDVKWDQIKNRTCYTGIIGTEEPTITIISNLCCSKFEYPVYQTNCSTFEKVST